ncbi:hypothetical protein [Methylobacterium brachythecii]|uniref:Uncharacterized protein n=1 Tax=Methylobacterium brachythecii TaxID=1176177 RepID=A0A7W6AQK0_9HYPH|nr:hypothetical protein [Methylobacterium brachythecii]MBB3905609.1 hypothetical protein [Methylobacterium brachythecii]GLS46964.1 hypothetical protein GCM10007884_49640 [Methylobacterium brachythecii]
MVRKTTAAEAGTAAAGRPDDRLRTTLIVDKGLITALKVIAVERHCAVNDLIVEAIEAALAAYGDTPDRPVRPVGSGSVETMLTGLRRDIEDLVARVGALEGRAAQTSAKGKRNAVARLPPESRAPPRHKPEDRPGRTARPAEPAEPEEQARPRLDVAGVRREAAALIGAQGTPMAHRALLSALTTRFTLPGKDISENLRTILVHPRATGFVLVKGQGYALDRQDER